MRTHQGPAGDFMRRVGCRKQAGQQNRVGECQLIGCLQQRDEMGVAAFGYAPTLDRRPLVCLHGWRPKSLKQLALQQAPIGARQRMGGVAQQQDIRSPAFGIEGDVRVGGIDETREFLRHAPIDAGEQLAKAAGALLRHVGLPEHAAQRLAFHRELRRQRHECQQTDRLSPEARFRRRWRKARAFRASEAGGCI
jgi:hypothetical protein